MTGSKDVASVGKITPEGHAVDAAMSTEVCKVIPTVEPAVEVPILKPRMVTTNADEPIVAPDVVITTEVAVVTPNMNDTAATLLAPKATLGVIYG